MSDGKQRKPVNPLGHCLYGFTTFKHNSISSVGTFFYNISTCFLLSVLSLLIVGATTQSQFPEGWPSSEQKITCLKVRVTGRRDELSRLNGNLFRLEMAQLVSIHPNNPKHVSPNTTPSLPPTPTPPMFSSHQSLKIRSSSISGRIPKIYSRKDAEPLISPLSTPIHPTFHRSDFGKRRQSNPVRYLKKNSRWSLCVLLSLVVLGALGAYMALTKNEVGFWLNGWRGKTNTTSGDRATSLGDGECLSLVWR